MIGSGAKTSKIVHRADAARTMVGKENNDVPRFVAVPFVLGTLVGHPGGCQPSHTTLHALRDRLATSPRGRRPAKMVIRRPTAITAGRSFGPVAAPGKVEAVEEAEIASQLVGGGVIAVKRQRWSDSPSAPTTFASVQSTTPDAKARLDSSKARIERLRSAIEQARSDLAGPSRDAKQSGQISLAGRGFTAPTSWPTPAHGRRQVARPRWRRCRLRVDRE